MIASTSEEWAERGLRSGRFDLVLADAQAPGGLRLQPTIDEFLACVLKERSFPVIIIRFSTRPRQTAIRNGDPNCPTGARRRRSVFGDGTQSRAFTRLRCRLTP